jgi:hypothetical protein
MRASRTSLGDSDSGHGEGRYAASGTSLASYLLPNGLPDIHALQQAVPWDLAYQSHISSSTASDDARRDADYASLLDTMTGATARSSLWQQASKAFTGMRSYVTGTDRTFDANDEPPHSAVSSHFTQMSSALDNFKDRVRQACTTLSSAAWPPTQTGGGSERETWADKASVAKRVISTRLEGLRTRGKSSGFNTAMPSFFGGGASETTTPCSGNEVSSPRSGSFRYA